MKWRQKPVGSLDDTKASKLDEYRGSQKVEKDKKGWFTIEMGFHLNPFKDSSKKKDVDNVFDDIPSEYEEEEC